MQVVKKNRNPGPTRPARKQEPRPTLPVERHSGEGSASALETLQKLEKKRVDAQPLETHNKDPES